MATTPSVPWSVFPAGFGSLRASRIGQSVVGPSPAQLRVIATNVSRMHVRLPNSSSTCAIFATVFDFTSAQLPFGSMEVEQLADLAQRETELLRVTNETDTPRHLCVVSPEGGAWPRRLVNESFALVEANRLGTDARFPGDVSDREGHILHLE